MTKTHLASLLFSRQGEPELRWRQSQSSRAAPANNQKLRKNALLHDGLSESKQFILMNNPLHRRSNIICITPFQSAKPLPPSQFNWPCVQLNIESLCRRTGALATQAGNTSSITVHSRRPHSDPLKKMPCNMQGVCEISSHHQRCHHALVNASRWGFTSAVINAMWSGRVFRAGMYS